MISALQCWGQNQPRPFCLGVSVSSSLYSPLGEWIESQLTLPTPAEAARCWACVQPPQLGLTILCPHGSFWLGRGGQSPAGCWGLAWCLSRTRGSVLEGTDVVCSQLKVCAGGCPRARSVLRSLRQEVRRWSSCRSAAHSGPPGSPAWHCLVPETRSPCP